VQYPDEGTADQAKEYLDGHCMYPNNRNKVCNTCCCAHPLQLFCAHVRVSGITGGIMAC
jgi:hypothetical protein